MVPKNYIVSFVDKGGLEIIGDRKGFFEKVGETELNSLIYAISSILQDNIKGAERIVKETLGKLKDELKENEIYFYVTGKNVKSKEVEYCLPGVRVVFYIVENPELPEDVYQILGGDIYFKKALSRGGLRIFSGFYKILNELSKELGGIDSSRYHLAVEEDKRREHEAMLRKSVETLYKLIEV